jgi:hypothetical protein
VEIVKDGKFVACNSSEGVILLFKWDWFGDCKDRIQGHPNTIDAMIKLNENTLITGSEDGFVRGLVNTRRMNTFPSNDSISHTVERYWLAALMTTPSNFTMSMTL